jgi:uncharacterized membrane protein
MPQLRYGLSTLATVVGQIMLLAMVVGALMLLWSARSHRDTRIELPVLLGISLAFTAFARVSGFLAESYNADRLYQQTFMILGVAIAYLASVGWHTPDGRALDQTIDLRRIRGNSTRRAMPLVAAAIVLFLNTTQLIAFLVGGAPTVAYSNSGEAAERYLYNGADVDGAQWAAKELPSGAMLFVDRYAVLPLWSQANRTGGTFATIAPSAIDRRGYVLLTSVNVGKATARGSVGASLAIFTTPIGFFDKNKNLIYSSGDVRIYR